MKINKKINKTILTLGVIALVVAAYSVIDDGSLTALIGSKKSKTSNKMTKVNMEARNQRIVRNKIKIRRVEFDKPGFVVLHRPEDLGNVHGTTVCRPFAVSNLITGRANNVSIGVGGGNVSGRLKVMMHYDSNNNGRFDDGVDLPVQENGTPMAREMMISP